MEFKRPIFTKVSDVIWEMPKEFKRGMLVPGRIYATEKLLKEMDNPVFDQLANVAALPGIQNYVFALGDAHSGYGFNIGGAAAFDPEEGGIISPGGVGVDINCGMRLILTDLTVDEVKPKVKELVDNLFKAVPVGVGAKSAFKIRESEFKTIAEEGAKWAIKKGYGWKEDIERTELNGTAEWADSSKISDKVIARGINQMGTLGSGNHYLEIQFIRDENIVDKRIAKKWGLFKNQVVITFHCGSRGAGHQIATDYLQKFLPIMETKYKIKIPDKELASVPFNSSDGQDYYKAMGCGVNVSFVNRQLIMHNVRTVFSKIFNKDPEKLGMRQLFDIAHNRASVERYNIDGVTKTLVVHRKGATASYSPGRKEIPKIYRSDGLPIIVGGSMETGSYLLSGGDRSEQTFCTTAHGAGRTMSRTKARGLFKGEDIQKSMFERGIYEKSNSWTGLAEEAGQAYKDIDEVVNSAEMAGLSRRIVKLLPIGGIKG